jgi:hypothetical protein
MYTVFKNIVCRKGARRRWPPSCFHCSKYVMIQSCRRTRVYFNLYVPVIHVTVLCAGIYRVCCWARRLAAETARRTIFDRSRRTAVSLGHPRAAGSIVYALSTAVFNKTFDHDSRFLERVKFVFLSLPLPIMNNFMLNHNCACSFTHTHTGGVRVCVC